MTRDEARAVANRFVLTELGRRVESDSARYEGGPQPAWVFTYPRPRTEGEQTDPSHLIVVVTVHVCAGARAREALDLEAAPDDFSAFQAPRG